jgi:hypothetical protein
MPRLVFALVFFCYVFQSFSQDENASLRIFLDCNTCDNTYIKQNLNNVQFVRDQNYADVHLFFTRQTNGSGGRLYEIEFIGKNEFIDVNDLLSFSTDTNMSDDDVRNRILEFIKLGLVRYWLKKGHTDVIKIKVGEREIETQVVEEVDPWNSWVFGIYTKGKVDGEELKKKLDVNLSVSAKRVTENNKFSYRVGYSEKRNTFTNKGEEITSTRTTKYVNISDVISIGGNWSAGAFGGLGSSVYRNKDFYWSFKPAIEYNFFNYSKSAEKQLTLSYRNGVEFNDYIEQTVFGEDKESLWEHELNLGGRVKQKWGNIYGEASFEQYLHDTTLNALSFYLGTSVRLFKGFNFNLSGDYSISGNQINLPAGDVSLEELLLQQQQLASGFNYSLNIGLSYSFGSIYNTVVNPRFNF